jgi:hypothetical protein
MIERKPKRRSFLALAVLAVLFVVSCSGRGCQGCRGCASDPCEDCIQRCLASGEGQTRQQCKDSQPCQADCNPSR